MIGANRVQQHVKESKNLCSHRGNGDASPNSREELDMPESVVPRPSSRFAAGEVVEKEFVRVVFQSGFPKDVGINGCRVEDVVQLAMERLDEYQDGPLGCEENEQAIQGLKFALRALEDRRRSRADQGVLNTMSRHETVRTEDFHYDFSATGA